MYVCWKCWLQITLLNVYVGGIKELLKSHNLKASDMMIVNLGAWYILRRVRSGEKVRKRCFRTRARVEGEHSSLNVLWMESTPQHFFCLGNESFDLETAKKNMCDIGSGSGTAQKGSGCPPLGNYSVAHATDWRNRLVEKLGIGLLVIPLGNYLWNLSYSHVRMDGHNYGTF